MSGRAKISKTPRAAGTSTKKIDKRKKGALSQVLPEVRVIPRLKATGEIADRLTEIAAAAYVPINGEKLGPEELVPLAAIFAPVRAEQSASFYLSEKAYEMPLPKMREILKKTGKRSLRKALQQVIDLLPSNLAPPFPQMKALFSAGDPNSNGLEDLPPEAMARQDQKEDLWNAHYAPEVVRNVLSDWITLMDDLHARTGSGRSPHSAESNFVARLLFYWKKELNASSSSSRRSRAANSDEAWDEETEREFEQKGLFAQFVRAAAEIIPEEYRPDSWDHPIREICEEKT